MNTIIYFIQANLFLSVFFLFYSVLLKKETFHLQNRVYLISAVLISIALPFFQSIFFQKIAEPITDFQSFTTVYTYTNEIATSQNISQKLSNIEIIKILYWAGVAISILILLIKTIRTINWIKTCNDKKGVAFSFFSKIFIDKNLDLFEIVHEHEKIHVNQFHFIDILIFELLKIVFWFNPAVHYYKKAITIIHEFLADESASRQLFCKSEYATLLVSKQFQIQPSTLFTQHFFNQSTLKTRIEMLLKNPSRKTALLKYGFLAPLLFIMLLVSSFTVVKDENVKKIVKEAKKIITQNELKNNIKTELLPDTLKPINGNEDIISCPIEIQPEFPGGLPELFRFLGQNIKYPKEAADAKIVGRVFIKFKILKGGSIEDISVLKSIGHGCDEEAIRVIKLMPKWKPGMQNGESIDTYFNLPIVFKLDNKVGYSKSENNDIEMPIMPVGIDLSNKIYTEKLVLGDSLIKNRRPKLEYSPNYPYRIRLSKIYNQDKFNYGKVSIKPNDNSYFYLKGNYGKARIYIDNKEISVEELNNLDPHKIKSVNINRNRALIATDNNEKFDGIIEIITK